MLLKFVLSEVVWLYVYLCVYGEVIDLLMMGGDLMVMSVVCLCEYLMLLLVFGFEYVGNIWIGMKVLIYWLYCFVSDLDMFELFVLLCMLIDVGCNVMVMVYLNYWCELLMEVVE